MTCLRRRAAFYRYLSNLALVIAATAAPSCGKDRHLSINEQWSTERPVQVDQSTISLSLIEDHSPAGLFSLTLAYSPSKVAALTCDESKAIGAEIGSFHLALKESCRRGSEDKITIGSSDLPDLSAAPVVISLGASRIEMKLPPLLFAGTFIADNRRLCFKDYQAQSAIRWAESTTDMVVVETNNYRSEVPDISFWRPEVDFFQVVFPNIPIGTPIPSQSQNISLKLSRHEFKLVDDVLLSAKEKKKLLIDASSVAVFPSELSSICLP